MIVYGRNVAKEILSSNKKILNIYLQDKFNDKDILAMINNRNLNVVYKSKKEIDNLANGVHQGIILNIPDYQYYNFKHLLNKDPKFLVILDHIEDPHNLGAIIRTCEAAGVDGIIMPKDRQVQVNATVMKTSVGTLDNVKICSVTNINNVINILKNEGFWIVGTALDNSIDYRNIDFPEKIALIIGNESSGISRIVRDNCDFIAKIPMYGSTNSLNVSVAAGIMIYEIIRNRK